MMTFGISVLEGFAPVEGLWRDGILGFGPLREIPVHDT